MSNLLRNDWRSSVFTTEWRLKTKIKQLSKVEKLAHILSRVIHGNMDYQQCDHCTGIAIAILPELEDVIKG